MGIGWTTEFVEYLPGGLVGLSVAWGVSCWKNNYLGDWLVHLSLGGWLDQFVEYLLGGLVGPSVGAGVGAGVGALPSFRRLIRGYCPCPHFDPVKSSLSKDQTIQPAYPSDLTQSL